MVNLEYEHRGSTLKAAELARNSESFSITLRGRSKERVLRGIDSYRRFNEYFVLREKKDRRVFASFIWRARTAVSFWGLCLYRDRERKNLEFQDQGDRLVVCFNFGSSSSHQK